ncbi:redoxin domain-containing protein [Nakamurella sp. YIM 132087]|uniref:Alkyl hydroperoxide reductase E n=1 Tax=Nakamurella alba TaxID=2665158 RepID=A0A7K1FHK4_9ACTN|nr:peroxiredoxin [Nakamurella alba]MTD13601.1 redoxin domain-containing protein [Nakamurella alba]
MTIAVGDTAPDFTLSDAYRNAVTLSSFRGEKAVLVVFYPFAFSGVCTTELCAVRDDLSSFENDSVQILAISTDPIPTLKAWAEVQEYTFPLLSDFWPHGAVSQAYGVFFEKAGMPLRGTFLVDTTGVVRFAEVNQPGEARDQSAWKRALAELAPAV